MRLFQIGVLLLVLFAPVSLHAWKAFSQEDDVIRSMSETILVGKLVSISTQKGKGTEQKAWYTIQPKKMMKGTEIKAPFLGCYLVPDATMRDEKGIVIGFKSPIGFGSGSEWEVKPTHEYIFYLGERITEGETDPLNEKKISHPMASGSSVPPVGKTEKNPPSAKTGSASATLHGATSPVASGSMVPGKGPYYKILRIDLMSETPGPLPLKDTGK